MEISQLTRAQFLVLNGKFVFGDDDYCIRSSLFRVETVIGTRARVSSRRMEKWGLRRIVGTLGRLGRTIDLVAIPVIA